MSNSNREVTNKYGKKGEKNTGTGVNTGSEPIKCPGQIETRHIERARQGIWGVAS